jgi:hypothetical protein
MTTRRQFLQHTAALAASPLLLPSLSPATKVTNVGLQLYSVREEMLADAVGTLKQLAKIGYKELESARSAKGHYYGLKPKEIQKICKDLGMTLRSGHVHVDKDWKRAVDEAAEAKQSYVICSSLPSEGQTVSNYQKEPTCSIRPPKTAGKRAWFLATTTTNTSSKRPAARCSTTCCSNAPTPSW